MKSALINLAGRVAPILRLLTVKSSKRFKYEFTLHRMLLARLKN
jgi:hypothetical protein